MQKVHNRRDKSHYFWVDGRIQAYSLKVASNTIRDMVPCLHSARLTQEEALALRGEQEIRLYIRHPLDRFVSAWKFFSRTGRHLIQRPGIPVWADKGLRSDIPLWEWADLALEFEDIHWEPQVEFHTLRGQFVPNRVIDVAYLGGRKSNRTTHGTVDEEFANHPELRKCLEEKYREDLELFERVVGKPDGIEV